MQERSCDNPTFKYIETSKPILAEVQENVVVIMLGSMQNQKNKKVKRGVAMEDSKTNRVQNGYDSQGRLFGEFKEASYEEWKEAAIALFE